MKRFSLISLALFTALCLCTSMAPVHKFYVSLTEIRYNSQSNRLEVSLRIFPDDMDRALETHYGIAGNLATNMEHPAADSLLDLYLDSLLEIEVNGNDVPLNYLGKEAEADVMWCYLESSPVPLPAEIEVSNPILTEIFPDQVNITQIYVGEWNRGLLLKKEQPRHHLLVGEF